jgi:conjugal transfer pilus assembly protein TraF
MAVEINYFKCFSLEIKKIKDTKFPLRIMFPLRIIFPLLIIIIILTISSSNAKSSYCNENKLGWKFYCDDEPIKEQPLKKPEQEKERNQKQSYRDELKELQDKVEEVKAKAVLYPTTTNLKEYMILNLALLNQAEKFSSIWKQVLWATPALDVTQQKGARPLSSVGAEVFEEQLESMQKKMLATLNDRYGIFFIYSSTCPYCQKYSQILTNMKKQYNLQIKGVSIDNNYLPNWEQDSFMNTGQLEQLGVDYSTVPVTILYDNTNNSIIPVGYGLMAEDELVNRIYVLLTKKEEEEKW